ncbi:MAG: hypothetical protein AAF765_07640 [Bacteroidota bacterium]
MKLKTYQWIILAIGVIGVLASLYGKTQGWDYGKFFPIFYAAISMIWIAILDNKRTCKRKKMNPTSEQINKS